MTEKSIDTSNPQQYESLRKASYVLVCPGPCNGSGTDQRNGEVCPLCDGEARIRVVQIPLYTEKEKVLMEYRRRFRARHPELIPQWERDLAYENYLLEKDQTR